jgi:hypothetical protein
LVVGWSFSIEHLKLHCFDLPPAPIRLHRNLRILREHLTVWSRLLILYDLVEHAISESTKAIAVDRLLKQGKWRAKMHATFRDVIVLPGHGDAQQEGTFLCTHRGY